MITIPKDRTAEQAYIELRKSTDVLLARALAFSPSPSAEDGPGLLMLPGLLNALRNAAEDVAAVKLDHEQS